MYGVKVAQIGAQLTQSTLSISKVKLNLARFAVKIDHAAVTAVFLVRLGVLIWAGGMMSAPKAVALITMGQVELESAAATKEDPAYSNIFWTVLGTFVGEGVAKRDSAEKA